MQLNHVSSPHLPLARLDIPIDEIWSWLSNCVLQRSSNGEGRAHTQAKTEDTAVQLPQAVFEPVSAAQALDSSPARGHGSLV